MLEWFRYCGNVSYFCNFSFCVSQLFEDLILCTYKPWQWFLQNGMTEFIFFLRHMQKNEWNLLFYDHDVFQKQNHLKVQQTHFNIYIFWFQRRKTNISILIRIFYCLYTNEKTKDTDSIYIQSFDMNSIHVNGTSLRFNLLIFDCRMNSSRFIFISLFHGTVDYSI